MIIDNFNVFSDSVALAAGNSNVVNVMPFLGRGEPVNVTICVTSNVNNLTSLTVKLQQADTPVGAFTDVGAGITLTLAELKAGCFRFELPDNAIKPSLRLNYTITGTAPTAGKIFAAITRDVRLGWATGQRIDKGRVVA